jgi:hypothetical protein
VATKYDLRDWLVDALKAHDGSATIVEVCQHIWQNHKDELLASGDLFYTWQYDVRWAATELRKTRIMRPADASPSGIWELL